MSKSNCINTKEQYFIMCEAIAYDLSDRKEDVGDIVNDVIDGIKTQTFLSDFEKTVRDYFNEMNIELNCEKIINDISKFF